MAQREMRAERDDGAVLQRDGVITKIGPAAELMGKHPEVPVLGSDRQVMLPGFVDAHHHIGLTPVQLLPDMPVELWFVTRLAARWVDLYLDTLYSAIVQHLCGWLSAAWLLPHIRHFYAGYFDPKTNLTYYCLSSRA